MYLHHGTDFSKIIQKSSQMCSFGVIYYLMRQYRCIPFHKPPTHSAILFFFIQSYRLSLATPHDGSNNIVFDILVLVFNHISLRQVNMQHRWSQQVKLPCDNVIGDAENCW